MATQRVLPSRTQPLARDVVEFLGGPPGKHAAIGGTTWWTPLRVLLAVASFFLALAYMQKAPCLRTSRPDGGAPFIDWEGNRSYTAACYNDVIPLFHARGLDQLQFPYVYSWVEDGTTRYMEYPVLTGLHQYVAALLGRGLHGIWEVLPFPAVPAAATYWVANCLLLSLAWLITVVCLTKMMRNRVWDTVVIVASPLVIVHAFTNWDVLSIMAAVVALFCWSRGKPTWAGIFLGLGIAFKLWPIFVFGALGLVCLQARQWRPMLRLIAGTAAAWVAVNAPIYLLAPDGWGEFFRMSSTRGFEGSTIYQVLADLGADPTAHLNLISFGALAAALLALTLFILFYPTPQLRVAQVCFLAVAAFVITNKVWSPQFSLWLLPLAVLALPKWKLIYLWATVEAVYWYLRMWQFLPSGQAAPAELVDTFTVLRIVLLVTMAVLIIRQMRGKAPDPVLESNGGLDPLAPAGWSSAGRRE